MLRRLKSWISRKAEMRRMKAQKQSHHERWELLMHNGAMRDKHTDKTNHKTLAEVGDDGVVVDYMDGRMIGQRPVVPLIVRPFGMGRWKL